MRILLINDDILPSARGGSAVIVEWLREELAVRGHDVTLLTSHQDATLGMRIERRDGGGRTVSLFVEKPGRAQHRRIVRNSHLSTQLSTVFSDLQADAVHIHNIHQFLTYECLSLARTLTPRIFLTAHDTQLVSYERVRGPAYERAALAGVPYRMRPWDNALAAGRKYAPLRNISIHRILRKTGTSVIAISDALDAFLRANGIEPTTVIPNGVRIPSTAAPEEVRTFRERYSLAGPTVLFGGRVSEDKGIYALLQAFELVQRTLPNAQLLIAGETARTASYLERISETLRKTIRITDWLEQDAMRVAYASCDVVTTPSLYLDAFNIMNTEAMASMKPVVGSVFGGIRDIIVDGKTGYVINPRATATFANALLTVLRDPALARRLGLSGRERVEEKYGLDAFTDRHEALYASGKN